MTIRFLIAALAFCAMLFGQSATPITYPAQSFSTYAAMEAQSVPASPAVITIKPLIFGGGWVACNASPRTILLTDGNGTLILPTVAVTANQTVSLSILAGAYVSGGFSISASGTGCTYHVWWRQ
jgi:hypothetical protein